MKNYLRTLYVATALGVLLAGCSHIHPPAARPDFKAALTQHLASIQQRDLTAFTDTLTSGNDLMVIFPAGQTLPTTTDVLTFHRDWFADENWVFTPEIVKIIEGDDQSTALLRYDYRDTAEAEPRASWLVLVFALEDGQWRLVHDQNTRIEPPAP